MYAPLMHPLVKFPKGSSGVYKSLYLRKYQYLYGILNRYTLGVSKRRCSREWSHGFSGIAEFQFSRDQVMVLNCLEKNGHDCYLSCMQLTRAVE